MWDGAVGWVGSMSNSGRSVGDDEWSLEHLSGIVQACPVGHAMERGMLKY